MLLMFGLYWPVACLVNVETPNDGLPLATDRYQVGHQGLSQAFSNYATRPSDLIM